MRTRLGRRALLARYEQGHRLLPGGTVVVDDCDPGHPQWNGAHAAYVDFCGEKGMEPDIRFGKLGFLEHPESDATKTS